MNQAVQDAIKHFQEILETKLKEVADTKKLINSLSVSGGGSVIYDDNELVPEQSRLSVAPDEFYNKPLATSVEMYLEKRSGAVRFEEIISALKSGGFAIENKKDAEQEIKNNLTKNPKFTFLRQSNSFGLTEWYGGRKSKKSKNDEIKEEIKKDIEAGKPVKDIVNNLLEEKK